MKKIIFLITIMFASICVNSQPIPPAGAGHGSSQNQAGNGAPIDGGFSILFVIGVAYGSKKLIWNKKILDQS